MGLVQTARQWMPAGMGSLVRKIVPRSVKAWIGKRLTKGIATRTPIVTVKDGRRFKTIEDGLFFRVFYEGIYEPDLSSVFQRLIEPKDLIIDVGGNFGWYATLFARSAQQGKVVCFEPVPDTFEVLRENIALNSQQSIVKLHPVCVGEKPGKVRFLRTVNSGLGHVATGNETGESVDIDVVTLDDQLASALGHIALIKIHVEGFELNVLKGSCNILSGNNPPIVQVKLTDDRLERYGVSRHDIFKFLKEAGMELYEMQSGGTVSKTPKPEAHEIFGVGRGKFGDRFIRVFG